MSKLHLSSAASAVVLGLVFAAQPIGLGGSSHAPGVSAALAKGGEGNGNGGGNGGGNGNAGGNGRGAEAASASDGRGNGRGGEGGGKAGGKDPVSNFVGSLLSGDLFKGGSKKTERTASVSGGSKSSTRASSSTATTTTTATVFATPDKLGRLNASHASASALAHAAPNSTVGVIATYMNLMLDAIQMADEIAAADAATTGKTTTTTATASTTTTPTQDDLNAKVKEALDALASIANKSFDQSVVNQVNANLGLTLDDTTGQAVTDYFNPPETTDAAATTTSTTSTSSSTGGSTTTTTTTTLPPGSI